MYNAIADASSKPIILYNVPSRTGVNIEPETYLELSKHPNITGIKEANGNLSKIVKTMSLWRVDWICIQVTTIRPIPFGHGWQGCYLGCVQCGPLADGASVPEIF